MFFQLCSRITVFTMLFGIYVLADRSSKMIKGEATDSIGNHFITMFETVIYPLFIIAYLLNSGVYDLLVSGF